MKRFVRALLLLAALAPATLATSGAQADEFENQARASTYTWHGNYYHTQWGTPVALVVPPTSTLQTNWGWGVTNTRVSRIDHQFQRAYPGQTTGGYGFAPTPYWPSDTNQFGVYYIRGPW